VAQGAITRLTYERLGILATDSPAYKNVPAEYIDFIRVQDFNYSFSHVAQDIKSIGSDSLITRDGQSPVLRAPDVNCSINYLFSEGQNELAAGLFIGKSASVVKDFISSSMTDINLIVVSSNSDSHSDFNLLKNESDFEGFDVLGIGNAFLTKYSYNAAVGQLPSASLTFAASNIKYDEYKSADRPTLPAIKLGIDNQESFEEIYLDESRIVNDNHRTLMHEGVFGSHKEYETSAIMHGDIKVKITKTSGHRGGAKLESLSALIQNVSIDLPIERQPIYGMGSNYMFDRKIKLPIMGSISMDMLFNGCEKDEIDRFLHKSDVFDIQIKHFIGGRIMGEEGSTYVTEGYYYVAIQENLWRRAKLTKLVRSVFGHRGDTEFIEDGSLYAVCVDGYQWGTIPLLDSEKFSSNEVIYEYDFIHVKYLDSWKKFSTEIIDFENLNLAASFDLAQYIVFDIKNAQLKQQDFNFAIGSNASVSSSLTFSVSEYEGLKLYFDDEEGIIPVWDAEFEDIEFFEPVIVASTVSSSFVREGSRRIELESYEGFDLGDKVVIDEGLSTEEIHTINDFGSLILEESFHYNHNAGSTVSKIVFAPIKAKTLLSSAGLAVTYSIDEKSKDLFKVDKNSGEITLNKTWDYEQYERSRSIILTATNSQGRSNSIVLNVSLANVPEGSPSWLYSSEVVEVLEGSLDVQIQTPLDNGGNPVVYYLSGIDSSFFEINSSTGDVVFKSTPDYEAKKEFELLVVAQGTFGQDSLALRVDIVDVADVAPAWAQTSEVVNILENVSELTINTSINEGDRNVTYAISGLDENLFNVDSNNGTVSFKTAPDYEQDPHSYSITLTATSLSGSSSIDLFINVIDDADVPPVWSNESETVEVLENTTRVNRVTTLNAGDRTVVYSLAGLNKDDFDVNPNTGEVHFKNAPDFETKQNYGFSLVATGPSGSDNLTIYVNIVDTADIAPSWNSAQENIDVLENTTLVEFLTPLDPGDRTVSFSLSGLDADKFYINPQTAEINFNSAPDFENDQLNYSLELTASSLSGSSSITLDITVVDAGDVAPVWTSTSETITVLENTTAVNRTTAINTGDRTVTYTLSGNDASLFNINSGTGAITFKNAPDYETDQLGYSIILTATNVTGSDSINLTINVVDVADVAPTWASSSETIDVIENTTAVNRLTALDSGDRAVTYSLSGTDASFFNINSGTGTITFKNAPDYETDQLGYSIILTATNVTGSDSINLTINVSDENEV
jgi:hypothetical protein